MYFSNICIVSPQALILRSANKFFVFFFKHDTIFPKRPIALFIINAIVGNLVNKEKAKDFDSLWVQNQLFIKMGFYCHSNLLPLYHVITYTTNREALLQNFIVTSEREIPQVTIKPNILYNKALILFTLRFIKEVIILLYPNFLSVYNSFALAVNFNLSLDSICIVNLNKLCVCFILEILYSDSSYFYLFH